MQSLREKKKNESKQKIKQVALKIFLSRGYSDTTIGQIAKKAEVGVGTIYNYFRSKAELFVSVFMTDNNLDSDIEKIIKNPDENLIDSINKLIDVYTRPLKMLPKSFWRELLIAMSGTLEENTDLRIGVIEADMNAIVKFKRLLQFYKNNATLVDSFNVEDASNCIYSIMVTQFLFYSLQENFSFEECIKQVQRQIEFILEGKYNKVLK